VRQVLRAGFCEWQTLPDSVQTDNEMGLGGNPNDPFPSWLSLYLAGLGIKHIFIRSHRPTDQPQIERNYRTIDELTDNEESRQNITNLQQALIMSALTTISDSQHAQAIVSKNHR
jgi:hypothetical protein